MQMPKDSTPPMLGEDTLEAQVAGEEAAEGANPLAGMIAAASDAEAGTEEQEEEEASEAANHIIEQADIGRRLGDLAFEIDTGESAQLSDDQQRLLHELLFEKGWASKEYELAKGFAVTLRTFSPDVSKMIAASLKEIADPDNVESAPSEREFIIYNNIASVAASLCRYGDKLTVSADEFESDESFRSRADFVSKLPAQVLDRMSEILNQFNGEVRYLLSGGSLKNS